jgi:TusE/DsrC/DsvC family sulfur relay protein
VETISIAMPDRDSEGYLVEPGQWREEVAKALANELSLALEDDHWYVIRFMRDFYDICQMTADARFVIRHLETRYPGMGRKRLFDLFPYGYVGQACKVAGMKRPRQWSRL